LITAETSQGLEMELGRLDSEKWVDAVVCGMELISMGGINSWGISRADWTTGELFVVRCPGFLWFCLGF